MMTKTKALILMLIPALTAIAFLPSANAQETPKSPSDIPVEAFAALPNFSGVRLSPNGSQLGYFVERDGVRNLLVGGFDSGTASLLPPPEKSVFSWFDWLSDDVLVFQTSTSIKRTRMRVWITETRIYSFDFKTKKFAWLGAPNRATLRETESQIERIVDYLPDDPDHVLIELDLNRNNNYELYTVDVRSGFKKIAMKERTGVLRWYTDYKSEIRLAYGYRSDEPVAYFRDSDGDWINEKRSDWAQHVDIEGFSEDSDFIYVSAYGEHKTLSLFKLDLRTGTISETMFSHPVFDIDSVVRHPRTDKIVGVTYTDDFPKTVYFDADLARVQRTVDAAMKNSTNTIVSKARNKELYFIMAQSDQNPGDYYLFNRDKGTIEFVAWSRAALDPQSMAKTTPVTIPVRDGETITGYLTLPQNPAQGPWPAIIMPHGGPEARDTAEWDYEAQFYASRGYIVLKPNFRGSTGYGLPFRLKGRNQWGGLMQDDVTDATKWLIAEGYADPQNICIVGSSYGGYAALMGVIKEPGLYRCAVSINGVANLASLKGSDRANSVGGWVWTDNMGLADTKDEGISPYHRAEDVISPVLLMSSVDDARVPWKMSQDMHKRLKKMKKDSTYVKIKDGTHNMVTAQSRLTALKAAEAFLAKHIGQ